MTREEIMNLGLEELETRAAEIATETAEADKEQLETLSAELDAIEERKAAIIAENEEKRKAAEAVAAGAGKEIEKRKEKGRMTNKEVRNSHEYIEAFAKYIKTGKDAECRALLTENVEGGVVPVPELVENRVRQAWENDEIFSRVSKTFIRGNLKVGFEVSATDAVVHTEGTAAPAEEELVLGIVNMVPEYIKKWITISDNVLALGAEEFLAYIYDELTYKIIKKAADLVVAAITSAPATSDADSVGVAQIEAVVDAESIIDAIATLGDEAQNPVIIASGATLAAVKKAALQANYAFDPFQGMTQIQKDGVTGAIVGDLSGVQANLPEGDAVRFTFDEYSLAERDLVKVVGKLLAAIAVVGPKMFAYITGTPASE
ncbi:MAG: phage major capsid protein [Lachnospiraceae bacterium]|nr:phage major capsid protein [Lachnospiraceae bacterium]